MVSETSDANFSKDVLEAKETILIDFWAPWCAPCRTLGPILEKVAEQTNGKAKVIKLNVDENQITAQKYGISGIPTVIVFKNGEMVDKMVGLQPEANYLKAIG